MRQLVLGDVDELVLRVIALLGDVVDPVGDGFTVPARTGAAEDDRDLGQGVPSAARVAAVGPVDDVSPK